MWFLDFLAYNALRAAVFSLNLLPLGLRVRLFTALIRLIMVLIPRYRKIARKNLKLAFPEFSEERREQIMRESEVSLARVFVDFARMHTIDEAWVRERVECPLLERFKQVKQSRPDSGVLLATGHLGSFELMAHCMPLYGVPISFIVRFFKLPRVNRWWTEMREAFGNKVIGREGAFQEVVNDLKQGRDVAILFDQNVTRNHAVFVEFFGKPAATTRAFALAAIRTKAPVFVASMIDLGEDRYRIEATECDFTQLYNDEKMDPDVKIAQITQAISKAYEQMIRQYPEGWFWVHRRWKTTPRGVEEKFYEGI